MKKTLVALTTLACMVVISFAQNRQAGKVKAIPATRAIPATPASAGNAAVPATRAIPATPARPVSVAKMKADGSPDMRYKANKEVVVGPLKKNGKPDMRYKANKGAAGRRG